MKQIKIVPIIIAIMLIILALPTGISVSAATSTWDGTTITQPTSLKTIDGVYYYEISTAEELAYIAKTGGEWLGYNYILANDITLNSVELTYDANGNLTVNASTLNQWTPINGFGGIFDGAGHSISGVYVNTTASAGFFANCRGDVSNLTITNSYIKGGIDVGGICGSFDETGKDMKNCYFDGAVVGTSSVGGLIGSNDCTNISNSGNYGDVWGNGSHVAGIVGRFDAYGIDNCFNEGNIYSTGDYVAGIAGSSRTYGISGCKNSGNITGNNFVGGTCGKIENANLSSCGNTGNISGTQYVGGICGYSAYYYVESWMGSIANGYNTGNVEGESYVGGITGYVNYANISNCINVGNITGTSTTGAIVGHSESIWGKGTVSGCYYLKNTSVNTNLTAFGNANEDAKGATSKDASFFCINSDKTLNKSGHTSTTIKENIVHSTCSTAGSYDEVIKCSVCGIELSRHAKVTPINTIAHEWDEWKTVKAPTCTAKGEEKRTCSRCNKFEMRDIDMIPHTASGWIVTKEAEVGVKGVETRTCSVCGAKENRDIAALPYVPTTTDDGEKVYNEVVTEEAKDVTELFAQAKAGEGTVEIKATTEDNKEFTIVFDNSAVEALGNANVSISAKVFTENLTVENAELVLEVTVSGATFENGKATVAIPFEKEVPAGKVGKMYFIADDGSKTDMNATFENGKVVFTTNHFSTYAVMFEDAPATGLSGGAIAGIVIAIVAVLAGAVVGCFFIIGKKNA